MNFHKHKSLISMNDILGKKKIQTKADSHKGKAALQAGLPTVKVG